MIKPTEAQVAAVIELINSRYSSEVCGRTEECSEGSYSDVFNDGMLVGESLTLYEIGKLLGLELELPDEPEYSL